MLSSMTNMFKVPDLRNKILFTLMMIVLYRIGAHIPVPGINTGQLQELQRRGLMAQNPAPPGAPHPGALPCCRA